MGPMPLSCSKDGRIREDKTAKSAHLLRFIAAVKHVRVVSDSSPGFDDSKALVLVGGLTHETAIMCCSRYQDKQQALACSHTPYIGFQFS